MPGNFAETDPAQCIRRVRSGCATDSEFGYKMQGIAAHVLLRLGYRIDSNNPSGNPDIVASIGGTEYRFEVEAEVVGPRPRKLTKADLASLTESSNIVGYFGLAIISPSPSWILVPATKLVRKTLPLNNMWLEALSDKSYSEAWTREFHKLLQESCRLIEFASFSKLKQMALEGQRL